jgi:hypothetical protein
LLAAPMPQMDLAALRDQIEERLMIKGRESLKVHPMPDAIERV